MKHWWYEKDGVATGPVGNEELRQLILSGDVAPNVLVWCTGYGNWWEYNSLIAEFGNDVLEWSLENMTDIKDAEDDGISATPPPMPKTPIASSSSTDQASPYIPLPRKQAAPLTDFVGNNRYQKRSRMKRSANNTAAEQRDGDILPGYSKEQHDADAIEAKANMYGCLIGIAFIAALVLFTLATSYICELLAPNNKALPSQIVGISALAIITIYLARKMTTMVKNLVGAVISIAPALTMSGILLASIAYLYLGFIGISYFIGYGYATLAMVVILLFRMAPIIPIAVFFGALHGLGWHWIASLAAALPGVALFSAFGVVGLFSLLRGR